MINKFAYIYIFIFIVKIQTQNIFKKKNSKYFHEKEKDRRVLLSPHMAHVEEILKKKKAHVDTTNNLALSITFRTRTAM